MFKMILILFWKYLLNFMYFINISGKVFLFNILLEFLFIYFLFKLYFIKFFFVLFLWEFYNKSKNLKWCFGIIIICL